MSKILAGLNRERGAAQLAPLVRDAALDALAAQGATLRGRFTRRYLMDASGEKPAAPRLPRLLEPDLTHCCVALAEQAVGQHFLVLVLAEAARGGAVCSSQIGPITDPAKPQDDGAIWWRALCPLD